MNIAFKLFIDDERFPPGDESEWIIARNFKEVKYIISSLKRMPEFISFDHDLGENEETGYDIAKWLCESDMDNVWKFPSDFSFYVHSQNPVGKKNIEMYLNSYLKQRN